MATSDRENFTPASEAFRKHSADLLTVIQDPEVLAWELYAENIISPAVRDAANNIMHERGKRTSDLLAAVDSQIAVDPGVFDIFLSVLRKQPSRSNLCERVKETYRSILTSEQPRPQDPPHQPGSSSPPWPRTDVTPVQQYASYLKSVYTSKKPPVYRWPQVKCKKYINLALIEKDDITKPEADQFMRATIHGNIDDIKKSKRATDIGQISQLPDGSQPKCILVEGAPGVGKSTLAWKLCRKWGKEKLLQQYQLVVLLRLRDKTVQAAMNISDLFQYHKRHIQQAAVEEIQDTGGKGVLLLFEGYDELPEELRTKNSIFLDVITGRDLPEATVLVTSRPWASEFLHRECKESISQHIEILGFTKANMQSYLKSSISNDPSLLAGLEKYISCYPHINSMMYIPLNSAIVVEVYRNSRKDDTLVPKTMTELYSSLVREMLLRHLLDHPVHGKNRRWRVRSFNDLPQDVYQQLCELGRIAYEGILHDQQVIFSDLPEDFETLGLMQCVPELYVGEGAAVSYNFLHLTVQEYLAAFHLSQQPVEKQIEHFRECRTIDIPEEVKRELYQRGQYEKRWDNHFHMVMRFLSGVKKFGGYPNEQLNTFLIKDSGDDSASVIRKVTFNTLHWLFEAQDNNIITELLGSSDIQLDEWSSEVVPFDCFVLGYCVSHSNCTWKIDLGGCHIGDEGVEMLVQGAVEEETHCTGGISGMPLSEYITSEGVKHLLRFPINKLELLVLSSSMLDSESCATLAELIPHVPHLKILDLSRNPICQGGAVPLMISLTTHNLLEELGLMNTAIGVEDCRALNELLSSSTSLKKLNISRNDLPPEAVELIISGVCHNTTLESLIMWYSHFSLQNTILLASVLRTNHTLVYLNLGSCNIDSDGGCQLASALCTNDSLQELNLWCNPIGVRGATAFAEMLRNNHTLFHFHLGECKNIIRLDLSIDSDGTGYSAEWNTAKIGSLQEWNLWCNPIGVEGATAFAEMLLKNESLKVLNLYDDSIGEEGTQKLIDSLTHNTTVQRLVVHEKYKSSITRGDFSRVIFLHCNSC